MPRKATILFAAVLCQLSIYTSAQDPFKFRPQGNIPVFDNNGVLSLAWAGGLNAAQYNTIDLNDDGLLDLAIFDRTTNKISTFISDGSQYHYSPRYEYYFPKDLNSWMLLADYDCDGRKDIFTNTTFGLKVYRNTFEGRLKFELQEELLMTQSGSQMVNLQVSASDLPAISDIDGDGDLDILVFNFAVGGSVEYHQNQSMETDGTCTNLVYLQVTSSWGNFEECDCGEFTFGKSCAESGGRALHAGGKSLLTFDQDGDGDQELVFGDEFCTNIAFMRNQGDPTNALFTEAQSDFPESINPIDFFNFPGLFYEDVNFDGRKDIIASPNLFENLGRMVDFKHSSYLYLNQGSIDQQQFGFESNHFLQDQMLETGEAAAPIFFDVDGDLDQDMVIANRGNMQDGDFFTTLYLFENTGNSDLPRFEFSLDDYLGLSVERLQSMKPSYADLNGDGRKDLIFAAATANGQARIYYLLNNSHLGFVPQSDLQILNINVQLGDYPHFQDINEDGRADLLFGKRTGRLELWLNTGAGDILNFEITNEALSGIVDDSFRRELVPLVSNINDDGTPELITIDATGVMRIYQNFLSTSETDPPLLFDLVLEPEDGEPALQTRLGRGASITSVRLDNKLPYLVIGSNQGGLLLLENLSIPGDGGSPGSEFVLDVFPNPGLNMVEIKGNQNFTFQIYNTLGQLVVDALQTVPNTRFRFDSQVLRNGVYLVRGVTAGGLSKTNKLIVAR